MLISFFVILLIEARGASARGNWRYLDLLAAVFFADYLLIEGAIAALFANREGNQSHLLCQQVIFCPKKKKPQVEHISTHIQDSVMRLLQFRIQSVNFHSLEFLLNYYSRIIGKMSSAVYM